MQAEFPAETQTEQVHCRPRFVPQQPAPQGHGQSCRRSPFRFLRRNQTSIQELRVPLLRRIPAERRDIRVQDETPAAGRRQQEHQQRRHNDGNGVHVAQEEFSHASF